MSENKDRASWTLHERAEHQRKLDEQRRQWEQEQAARKEQRDREAKQAELEAYLRRRSQDWRDMTNSEPSMEELRQWQREYAAHREQEYQAELAERRARAEAQYRY